MIQRLIRRLSRQRKKGLFVSLFCVVGAGAFVLASASLAVPGFRVFSDQAAHVWVVLGLALAAAVILAAAGVVLVQFSAQRLLAACDRRLGLKDRLVTAHEYGHEQGPMAPFLHRQVDALAAGVDPRKVYPLSMPRSAWALLAGVAVFSVLSMINFYGLDSPPEADGLRLSAAARDQLDRFLAHKKKEDREDEVSRKMKQLARELKDQELKHKEALAKIAQLTQFLQARKNRTRVNSAEMKKAAAALSSSELSRPFAQRLADGQYKESTTKLKALSRKMKDLRGAKVSNRMLDAMASAWNKAARAISQKKLSSRFTKVGKNSQNYDRQAAGDALDDLADDMDDLSEELEEDDSLRQAMKELEDLEESLCEGCSQCAGGDERFALRRKKKGRKKAGRRRARLQSLFERPKNNAGTATMERFGGKEKRTQGETAALPVKTIKNPGRKHMQRIVTANDGSKSSLADKDVYVQLKRKAQATMFREDVPLGIRKYIVRYFDNIRPQEESDP